MISFPDLHPLPLHAAPPKIAPFDFGEAPANFEDSVSVNCLVTSGDLPIDIEWLFGGEPINFSTGIAVLRGGKRTSLLTIDSVHAGHAGNYSCKARNKAASSEYSAALVVNGWRGLLLVHLTSSLP